MIKRKITETKILFSIFSASKQMIIKYKQIGERKIENKRMWKVQLRRDFFYLRSFQEQWKSK